MPPTMGCSKECHATRGEFRVARPVGARPQEMSKVFGCRASLTSLLGFKPPKIWSFTIKTRVKQLLGMYSLVGLECFQCCLIGLWLSKMFRFTNICEYCAQVCFVSLLYCKNLFSRLQRFCFLLTFHEFF